MKNKRISIVVILCLITGTALAVYSYNHAKSNQANGGKGKADAWQLSQCECIGYAADKLNEKGKNSDNTYKNVKWSSAGNWIKAAKDVKISSNKKPKRGDIAWFDYNHVVSVDANDPK